MSNKDDCEGGYYCREFTVEEWEEFGPEIEEREKTAIKIDKELLKKHEVILH
jgi:hypothetical protein